MLGTGTSYTKYVGTIEMYHLRLFVHMLAAVPLAALAGLFVVPATDAQSGLGDIGAAPRCEVEVDLMAVVYNDRTPERSFAMVAEARGLGRMVGVGSLVAGKPILAILPRAVWLGPERSMCWIPLDHEGKQRVSSRKRAKKRSKRRRRRRKKK